VYCAAHPDLYNMTSNRETVEPGGGGPNNANGSTFTESGCVLVILHEKNALSLASEEGEKERDGGGTGLESAPLPHQRAQSPSLQLTYHFNQSNTKIHGNKGSSRTDNKMIAPARRLAYHFRDQVSPRVRERVRPDSVVR